MEQTNLPGQELINSLSKLLEKKQGNVGFLSLINKASPYAAIFNGVDSGIAAISGKNLGDTGLTGTLAAILPGLTGIFSTKVKKPTIDFKPNASYASTFKDIDKLNDASNK